MASVGIVALLQAAASAGSILIDKRVDPWLLQALRGRGPHLLPPGALF